MWSQKKMVLRTKEIQEAVPKVRFPCPSWDSLEHVLCLMLDSDFREIGSTCGSLTVVTQAVGLPDKIFHKTESGHIVDSMEGLHRLYRAHNKIVQRFVSDRPVSRRERLNREVTSDNQLSL